MACCSSSVYDGGRQVVAQYRRYSPVPAFITYDDELAR